MNREADREAFHQTARDLVAELRERAAEADELRRVPDATIESFRQAGLFRLLRPRAFGGHEMDYDLLPEITTELARGCASSAWTFSVLAMHEWFLALFPEAAQRSVWEGPGGGDALIVATFAPEGRAVAENDGYRLKGRWRFASGCDHAEWITAGALVEGEAPGYRSFLLNRSKGQWRIEDTWFVAGLRGTGSKDIIVDDVFVPAEHTLSMDDALTGNAPGAALHGVPLYRMPFIAALGFALAAVAPGVAARALEAYSERMRERVYTYSTTRQAEHGPSHIRLAESDAEITAARLIIERDARELMDRVRRGEKVPIQMRARAKRDVAWAVLICVRAVDRIFTDAGAGSLFDTSPMQRAFRDVHAVAAHAMHNFDLAAEDFGRIHLGLEPRNAV